MWGTQRGGRSRDGRIDFEDGMVVGALWDGSCGKTPRRRWRGL
jgi:hypothetical protein